MPAAGHSSLFQFMQQFLCILDVGDDKNINALKRSQIGASRFAALHRQDEIDIFIFRGNELDFAVQARFNALYEGNPVIVGIAPAAVFDRNFHDGKMKVKG